MVVMQVVGIFARFFAQLSLRSLVNHALAWTLLFSRMLSVVGSKGFGQIKRRFFEMLWTILVILLVLWLIGLLSNVGGGFIHLLLVVAVVVLVINLVTGRRAV